MNQNIITFDQLPQAVFALGEQLKKINNLLEVMTQGTTQADDKRMTVEELCEYLPGGLSKLTVYGYVQRREIPFARSGKRLFFLKSEIDEWLRTKQVKTSADLHEVAQNHLPFTKKARRSTNQ